MLVAHFWLCLYGNEPEPGRFCYSFTEAILYGIILLYSDQGSGKCYQPNSDVVEHHDHFMNGCRDSTGKSVIHFLITGQTCTADAIFLAWESPNWRHSGRLNDGLLEEILGHWGQEVENHAVTSSTLAHQGDQVWISTKSFDVGLDPLYGKVLKQNSYRKKNYHFKFKAIKIDTLIEPSSTTLI